MLAGFPEDRYPGRGFVVGRGADGKARLHLYWLTGRSENSRNRVLVEEEGAIRTATADPTTEGDTSLTVYTALRREGEAHIVGNGDQVDTVADHLARGGSAQDALRTRSHEPDDPIFTPRITAVDSGGILLLSKISTAGHAFYEPRRLLPGQGFGLRTYSGDGNPVRAFDGDPFEVALDVDPEELAYAAWELLDPELRVALVLKEIAPDASVRHTIVNRYERVAVSPAEEAVAALAANRPVVLPTDTVYGLCVNPHSEDAYHQIGRLKGRGDQPVGIIANALEDVLEAVPELRGRTAELLAAILPGPYTLIVPNPARRFPWLSVGNEGTLGIRVPDLPSATRDVLSRFGPVAGTSANRHGGPDPRTLADVPEEIRAEAFCLDGGEILGVASTVVDLTGEEPRVLREGAGDVRRVLEAARA